MEVPGLGGKFELQLLACITATAPWDLSPVCGLHHSLWQCWILNPLSNARNWTCILMDTNQAPNPLNHRFLTHWTTMGTQGSINLTRAKREPCVERCAWICACWWPRCQPHEHMNQITPGLRRTSSGPVFRTKADFFICQEADFFSPCPSDSIPPLKQSTLFAHGPTLSQYNLISPY